MGSSFAFPPLGSDTKKGVKKKASPRIPSEAVRMALEETRREACAMRRLCKVSSSLKLLTFHSTTALQRCSCSDEGQMVRWALRVCAEGRRGKGLMASRRTNRMERASTGRSVANGKIRGKHVFELPRAVRRDSTHRNSPSAPRSQTPMRRLAPLPRSGLFRRRSTFFWRRRNHRREGRLRSSAK